MTMTANLADGRVLNFPDGTDPSVIQATVKRMLGGQQEQPQQLPPLEQLRDLTIQRSRLPRDDTSLDEQIAQLRIATNQPDTDTGEASEFTVVKPSAGSIAKTSASMLSELPIQAAAGVAGMGAAMNPFLDEGAGGEVVRDVQTYLRKFTAPDDIGSQHLMQNVGGVVKPYIDPLIKGMESAKDVGFDIAGPVGAAVVATIPEAILTAIPGARSIKSVARGVGGGITRGVKGTAGTVADVAKSTLLGQSKKMRGIESRLDTGEISADLAGFKLDRAGQAIPDKVAREVFKQGFEPSGIAPLKAANLADRSKMLKQIKILRAKKNNQELSARPSDIAGESAISRFNYIAREKKKFGAALDVAAENLKTKSINIERPVSNFLDGLDSKLGIKLDKNNRPIFRGSDIEGLGDLENIVSRLVHRMSDTAVPNGHDVHRLKRYIDKNVNYDVDLRGLDADVEGVFKDLRRGLNESLREISPEYKKANLGYSKSIEALDEINDFTPRRVNLHKAGAEKALGQELRKLYSNYSTRVGLGNAVQKLDDTAKSLGGKFPDNVTAQTYFSNLLDAAFDTSDANTFKRSTGKAVSGPEILDPKNTFVNKILTGVAERISGRNERAAIKALEELLRDKSTIIRAKPASTRVNSTELTPTTGKELR